MKKLLGILVLGLLWCNTVLADDIQDFEIEGISLGDSALNYFSEEEIKSNISGSYKSDKYYPVSIDNNDVLKNFDYIQLHFKKDDNKYIVYSIAAYKNIKIKPCLNRQKKDFAKFTKKFPNLNKIDEGKRKHPADESGNSFTYDKYLISKSGGITFSCYDMAEGKDFAPDSYLLGVDSSEFNDFLNNEAWK